MRCRLLLPLVVFGSILCAAVARAQSEDPLARPESALPSMRGSEPPRTYSSERPAFVDRLEERRGNREPRRTAAERRATRNRHRGLGPQQASDLARRTFPDEVAQSPIDVEDPLGGSFVRTTGRFGALIRDDDSNDVELMLSTSPVRQPLEQGGDSLDLNLERVGETVRPSVPLIGTEFTDDARTGVRFPGNDFGIGVAARSTVTPMLTGDRMFYGEVATDTDMIMTPRPQGAEVFFQLRSADSPESLTLDIDMPDGATLRELRPESPIPGDIGPWPLGVIADGGEQLGVIFPPASHDAEGRPFPSRLLTDGSDLRLEIDHRGRSIAYPLLSDPEILVRQGEYSPSQWRGWRHQVFRSTTSVQKGHYPYFGAALGDSRYGPGLYLSMPTNQGYWHGDFSELIWQAPTGVFLTGAKLNYISHAPFYSQAFHGISNVSNDTWSTPVGYVNQVGAQGPNPFGLASFAFYGATHTFCHSAPGCNFSQGEQSNNLIVGLQANNPGGAVLTGNNKATTQINAVELRLGDRLRPAITSGIPASRSWFDDAAPPTRSFVPNFRDDGLGVKRVNFSGDLDGPRVIENACTGHIYDSPCPRSSAGVPLSYRTPEGVNRLALNVTDVVGNNSGDVSWTERVDRSKPDVALSGTLKDSKDNATVLSEAVYGLRVDATDGSTASLASQRAGVTSVDILVDDVPQLSRSQSCMNGSCRLAVDWELRTQLFSHGRHTVRVIATDALNHQREVQWDVFVDHRAGELEHYVFSDQRFGQRIESKVNVAHGNLLVRVGDLSIGDDDPPLVVSRSYNSRTSRVVSGAFGNGWTMDTGADLRLDPRADGSVELQGPSGYRVTFEEMNGGFTSPRGLNARLTELDNGRYELDYVDRGEVLTFSQIGRLLSTANADAADESRPELRFEYDASGRLANIRNDRGTEVVFEYNDRGLIGAIASPGGRHQYRYDVAGNLIEDIDLSGRATTYAYDAGNRLIELRAVDSDRMQVTYSPRGQVETLTRVTDPANGTGPGTTHTYASGRSTARADDAAEETSYAFDKTLFVTSSSLPSAPEIALSGSLADRAGATLESDTRYELDVRSTENGRGVRYLSVNFDGGEQIAVEYPCSGACSANRSWTLDTAEFPAGEYVVEAYAENNDAERAVRRVVVRIGDAPPASSSSSTSSGPDSDPDAARNSSRFRRSFGLNDDEQYVATVNSDPAARARSIEFGVPLTAEEVEELYVRGDAQDELAAVDTYVAENGLEAIFAGTWTDHPNGGIIYVGFTSNAETHVDEIRKRYRFPERLRAFVAQASLTSLQTLQRRIVSQAGELRGLGILVRLTATMVEGNKVEVGIEDFDASKADTLRQRYGPSVEAYGATATSDATRDTPYRRIYPGLRIRSRTNDGPTCTAGWSVRTAQPSPSGRHRAYLVTAGHCGGSAFTAFFQGPERPGEGRRIGRTVRSVYKDGTGGFTRDTITVDSQLISSTRSRVGKRVWLPPFRRVLSGIETDRTERPGNIVCSSGGRGGVSCGELKTETASFSSEDGVELEEQRLATYEAEGGDSGGPIYRPRRGRRALAVGVHQGFIRRTIPDLGALRRSYGHVTELQESYDVRVCVEGLCR